MIFLIIAHPSSWCLIYLRIALPLRKEA